MSFKYEKPTLISFNSKITAMGPPAPKCKPFGSSIVGICQDGGLAQGDDCKGGSNADGACIQGTVGA